MLAKDTNTVKITDFGICRIETGDGRSHQKTAAHNAIAAPMTSKPTITASQAERRHSVSGASGAGSCFAASHAADACANGPSGRTSALIRQVFGSRRSPGSAAHSVRSWSHTRTLSGSVSNAQLADAPFAGSSGNEGAAAFSAVGRL